MESSVVGYLQANSHIELNWKVNPDTPHCFQENIIVHWCGGLLCSVSGVFTGTLVVGISVEDSVQAVQYRRVSICCMVPQYPAVSCADSGVDFC